jgi:hypothetical protein
MRNAFEFAYGYLGVAAESEKEKYDKKLKVRDFHIGSKAWRWYPPLANQKVGLGWSGPYTIKEK